MKIWIASITAMALALCSAPGVALAAGVQVSQISGTVTVDGAPAGGAAIKVGDVVTTGPGSSAVLTFPDGCQITVSPGSTIDIGAVSPCAAASGTTGGTQTVVVAGGIIIGAGILGIVALTSKSASP